MQYLFSTPQGVAQQELAFGVEATALNNCYNGIYSFMKATREANALAI